MAGSPHVLKATDQNFEQEVLKSEALTLVDFWAEWCGPCRGLAPILDEIANDYAGQVKVYKMNIDENQDTPGQFNVRSIPTVIFLKGGKLVDEMMGLRPKEAFVQKIQQHLG